MLSYRTFKRYLNYAESPKNKSALSDEEINHVIPLQNLDVCAHPAPNHNTYDLYCVRCCVVQTRPIVL